MEIQATTPRLVIDDFQRGFHNIVPTDKDLTFKDLSTICIIPCGATIPTRVVQTWLQMATPMNQKFVRIFAQGMEVGAAYTAAIDNILQHPQLKEYKYVLTIEHDNMVSYDSLLKLYDSIGDFDAISGLYFTKGEGGKPMCYGRPGTEGFEPFLPTEGGVVPCNGTGMGFLLMKMEMLKDPNFPKPIFETVQDERGMGTQDLMFAKEAIKLGYKFAVDTDVKIGHFDLSADMVW